MPAAATRRTTTSGSHASTSRSATTRRCTSGTRCRISKPSLARTRASPYDGFDTGYLNKNHNILASLTQGLRLELHHADEAHLEPPAGRSAAERRLSADALHESRRRRSRCRVTASRFPGICRRTRAAPFRSAARRSCCSCIRTRPGSRQARHPVRRFVRAHRRRSDLRAYGNAVEALNTTSAALPASTTSCSASFARSRPRSMRRATPVAPTRRR